MTYIGGPTALVEWRGLRLLTDPTFDPPGTVYRTAAYELRKTIGPALPAEAVQPVDVVLLNHEQLSESRADVERAFRGLASGIGSGG